MPFCYFDLVVHYGDLNESSDNDAIGGLLDEHTIRNADAIQEIK